MSDCIRTTLYLDGELPADQEDAALQHLAGCSDCQTDVADWAGLYVALSRSGGASTIARSLGRRSRWRFAPAFALAAAAAAIALVWLWRGRPGEPEGADRAAVIALADTRALEPRVSAPAFDRYRAYRVDRGATGPHEIVPIDAVAELARRRDHAGLAAAHLLAGDHARATAALDAAAPAAATPAAAAIDSDRAAIALTARDPAGALALADRALAAAPELTFARWNRALALHALELPLAAAAEFDLVAARNEPGWSGEARDRAAALRAPIAERAAALAAYKAAAQAMIAGTGGPLDLASARRHSGAARRALYHALAVAGSADDALALAPLARELDRIAGNDHASRAQAAIAGLAARDFAIRRRFRAAYRALVERKLDDAERAALIADLERAGPAASDLLLGALQQAPQNATSAAITSQLARATPAGEPWHALQLARREAAAKLVAGQLFAAEQVVLATAPVCRDRAWALVCGNLDLDLAELYVRMRRLDEADRRLTTARAAFALSGAVESEEYTLSTRATLAWLYGRERLAAGYLEEVRLRGADRCDRVRFADETAMTIAFATGDLATARARLPDRALCGRPPGPAIVMHAVALARLGEPGHTDSDRERARAVIELARSARGPNAALNAAAAQLGDGRLQIDGDPTGGAAQIRAGLAALAELASEPGHTGELRGWGFAALIGDAARRGDHAGALAVFGEELGRTAPAGCVVAASLDDERSTAVVRGRDGVVRGSYHARRPLGALDAGSVVPAALIDTLDGCEAIAVIAQPPLHGRADLLPAALPWAFVGAAASPRKPAVAGAAARRVIVGDPRPPEALGLPALPPIAADRATLVTGSAATPARVVSELATADYVEIHAHGIADASDAAFLALSPDPDGQFALTARELASAQLTAAPIVALAACRAAATTRYQTSRWSLPDALITAGARAVIASAAAIPDDQGSALFAALRERIDRGEPVAQAVAALRAQRVAAGQLWAAGLMVFE